MQKSVYTIKELRSLLNVAKSTLYDYIMRGYIIEASRINKRKVFYMIDAEALVQHFIALRREIPPQLLELVQNKDKDKVC